jgi:hypothetical protein
MILPWHSITLDGKRGNEVGRLLRQSNQSHPKLILLKFNGLIRGQQLDGYYLFSRLPITMVSPGQ